MTWTLARRAHRMNPSIIREILKVTERPGIISLAGGLPSPDTFPVEAMREAADRVLRDAPREALQYAASEGYGPLREWVAQAMNASHVSAAGADRLPAASLHQASRLIRHVRRNLHQIAAPAVVLHASEDDVSGARSVLELQRRLGTTPEVHWFHHSYHMLTLDNERGIRMEGDCDGKAVWVKAGADDKQFRLDPAPAAACKALAKNFED